MRKNAKYRRNLARAPSLVRLVVEKLSPSATLNECSHGSMGWGATVTFRGVTFRIVYDRGYVNLGAVLNDDEVQVCPAWYLDVDESVAAAMAEAMSKAADVHRG
jgi:hypothetical protein